MDATVFDTIWQAILYRQYSFADAIDKAQNPEISRKALREVAEFARLPSPDSGHELNLRRVFAHSMMIKWKSELNRPPIAHSQ